MQLCSLDRLGRGVLGRDHVGDLLPFLALDDPVARIGERGLGIGDQQSGELGDRPGQEDVVGVDVADQLAAGHLEAAVQGLRLAHVRVTLPAQPLGVSCRVALEHLRSLVGGAVVEGQQLQVRVVLGEDAVERLLEQPACAVVGRNDDRDQRLLVARLRCVASRDPPESLIRHEIAIACALPRKFRLFQRPPAGGDSEHDSGRDWADRVHHVLGRRLPARASCARADMNAPPDALGLDSAEDVAAALHRLRPLGRRRGRHRRERRRCSTPPAPCRCR